jgi:outer membrane murein-binding lipoprotein Lpp
VQELLNGVSQHANKRTAGAPARPAAKATAGKAKTKGKSTTKS